MLLQSRPRIRVLNCLRLAADLSLMGILLQSLGRRYQIYERALFVRIQSQRNKRRDCFTLARVIVVACVAGAKRGGEGEGEKRRQVNRCGDLYYGSRGWGVLGRVRRRSPPNFNFTCNKQAETKQWLRGFSLICFRLVERREDVITGKPETSNTFLIKRKTIYDGFLKTSIVKEVKSRILYSRSSDYATRQVFML